MWTECYFPCVGPQKTCLGRSTFAFRLHETIARRSPFRISYWEADVKVWFDLRFFASRCGAVPMSCLQMQLSAGFLRVESLSL